MKKIIIACGAAVMMAGGLVSCNGGGSSAAANSFEDSLSQSIGEMGGSQLNMQYTQLPEEMRAKFNKKEMLEGIKTVILTDTARQSYLTGMQIASQLWGQLYIWEQSGIKIDRKAIYAAYEKAFLADSVADMSEVASRNNLLMSRVNKIVMEEQQRKAEAEAQAKANSPEAKKNAKAGEDYINEQMKNDPSIKRTESGLAYKVVSEGTGEKAGANSRVTVKYSGKLINGKEFDANDNATFPVRGVIPGFGEGLQLMNKGAHYILYIPGNLGYGVDGTPDGSIGPNDTLVFDVEVKDIK